MIQYYLLKVNIPGFVGDYWAYSQQVRGMPHVIQHLVINNALFADTYSRKDVMEAEQMLKVVFPGCIVTLVECGPEALPEDARRILNLV